MRVSVVAKASMPPRNSSIANTVLSCQDKFGFVIRDERKGCSSAISEGFLSFCVFIVSRCWCVNLKQTLFDNDLKCGRLTGKCIRETFPIFYMLEFCIFSIGANRIKLHTIHP